MEGEATFGRGTGEQGIEVHSLWYIWDIFEGAVSTLLDIVARLFVGVVCLSMPGKYQYVISVP